MKRINNPWTAIPQYNCFGCCPTNPIGTQMRFFEDGEDIISIWKPTQNHQSWMNTLHGGIQATLLDEAAGWLISRKFQTSGMTTNLNIKYKRPIPTTEGTKVEIRAHIREMKRSFALMEASITCNGELCSTAELTFYCFSQEKAREEFHFLPYEVEK